MVDNGLEEALILEDDIELHRGFKEKLLRSVDEFRRNYSGKPALVSYEDSALMFVPRSQRRPGRMLYPASKNRYTGAYLVNRRCAEAILNDVSTNKCPLPIDCYHTYLAEQGKFEYLWCHPTIATQGSFTGRYTSAIEQHRHGFIALRWYFKLYYKKMLYFFR